LSDIGYSRFLSEHAEFRSFFVDFVQYFISLAKENNLTRKKSNQIKSNHTLYYTDISQDLSNT